MRLAVWDPEERFRRWRDALVQHAGENGVAVEVIDARTEPDAQADIALVWKPPESWLAGQAGLRAVFALGAGVDALLPALTRHAPGVPLYRLEDAGMARQMSDYVTEAVLHAWRRGLDYAQQQREARWEPLAMPPRASFTVGFLGLGELGTAAARRIAANDFPVQACTRSGVARAGADPAWPLLSIDRLDEFLASTRVLVALLPLTASTLGLLDYAALRQLPRGAHVVNAGRGAVLDPGDLLELLDEGHLASATLDVFHHEPLPIDDALWRHPRVRITPHVAAQTLVGAAASQIMRAIAALERGEQPGGRVDPVLGY